MWAVRRARLRSVARVDTPRMGLLAGPSPGINTRLVTEVSLANPRKKYSLYHYPSQNVSDTYFIIILQLILIDVGQCINILLCPFS